jgi:hypothetical protein
MLPTVRHFLRSESTPRILNIFSILFPVAVVPILSWTLLFEENRQRPIQGSFASLRMTTKGEDKKQKQETTTEAKSKKQKQKQKQKQNDNKSKTTIQTGLNF